jgi:hypothetical protein
LEELGDLFFGDGSFDVLDDLDDFIDSVGIRDTVADEVQARFKSSEPVRVFGWYHNSLGDGLGFEYLNVKNKMQNILFL